MALQVGRFTTFGCLKQHKP
jgi:hypothetical protein